MIRAVLPPINVNATAHIEVDNPTYFLARPESDFFYGQVIPFAGGWAG